MRNQTYSFTVWLEAWAGVHKPVGGSKREGTTGGGGMTTSYWGLKGQEDLSNGVRALFAMEGFFRPRNRAVRPV